MILNAQNILQAKQMGQIIYRSPAGHKIEDFAQNQSVDVHLGDWIYVGFNEPISIKEYFKAEHPSPYFHIDNDIISRPLKPEDLYIENNNMCFHLNKGEIIGFWKKIKKEGTQIKTGTFFLAYTEEFIGTAPKSNLHPQWHLRSTLARMGLGHAKAGWGDIGYYNRWAMEFYTYQPIKLKAGMRIGQISFSQTLPDSGGYGEETGNYQKGKTIEEVVANWRKEDILPKSNNF